MLLINLEEAVLKIVGVAAVGAIVGKSFVTFKDKDEPKKKLLGTCTALGSQAGNNYLSPK